jgi:prophage DNA circulation protein
MNTLQRVADIESEMSKLKGTLAMAQTLSTSLPRIEQSLAALTSTVQELIEQSNKALTSHRQMIQTTANQNVALEQSVIQLGRTLTAITEELTATFGFNQSNVTARIRKIEDDLEKDRIKNLLTYKAIQPSEVVNEQSIVIASESFTPKAENGEAQTEQKSDYLVLELASQHNDRKIVSDFLGKKAGDTVSIEIEQGTITLLVKEVYEYAQKIESQGETEAAGTQEEQKEEEVKTESTATT